jgi:hypothetical protein
MWDGNRCRGVGVDVALRGLISNLSMRSEAEWAGLPHDFDGWSLGVEGALTDWPLRVFPQLGLFAMRRENAGGSPQQAHGGSAGRRLKHPSKTARGQAWRGTHTRQHS